MILTIVSCRLLYVKEYFPGDLRDDREHDIDTAESKTQMKQYRSILRLSSAKKPCMCPRRSSERWTGRIQDRIPHF